MGCLKLHYQSEQQSAESNFDTGLKVAYRNPEFFKEGKAIKMGSQKKNGNYYLSFGMQMPARNYNPGSDYRFGFNGHESDNEIFGNKNSYNFGARMYNPRLGRMFSVDPWTSKYAWQSPYSYHRNSPVWRIDWMGYGDGPSWWESFLVGTAKGVGQLYTTINNNPAHAGYSVKPQVVTEDQVKEYSINLPQQLNPYNQIESFAEGAVNTVQGVGQFVEGMVEGDGTKSAEALPAVINAAATVYGLRGFSLAQKITARTNLANSFYRKSGVYNIQGHMKYVNTNKAVYTKTIDETSELVQYRTANEAGTIGNYYAPKGTTPGQIGLDPKDVVETYNVKLNKGAKVEGLYSTHVEGAELYYDATRTSPGGGIQILVLI